MTGKERVQRILNRQEVDRSAFWMGNPHEKALEIYCRESKTQSKEELSQYLNNDVVWIIGEEAGWDNNFPYLEPIGKNQRHSLNQDGVFAETTDVEDVLNAYWPDPVHFNYQSLQEKFQTAKRQGAAIFSGMWSPFWHVLTDFFGMENCFVKMYTDEDVVLAVVNKLTDFYLKANKLFLDIYAKDMDVFFFGNDLGSQLNCLISPEMFRKFVLPSTKKIIDLAKSYNLKVALHSCGAIAKLIPDLIEAGVDVLHPIQAHAKDMDAVNLQSKFGGKIIFMGGLDTQDILPFKSTEEIKKEIQRLRGIFGKYFILSPSHEALLENVSFEKVKAMSDEANRIY